MPLVDIIDPKRLILVAAGGDHYFAEDEDINLKPIAMVKTTGVMIGRRERD